MRGKGKGSGVQGKALEIVERVSSMIKLGSLALLRPLPAAAVHEAKHQKVAPVTFGCGINEA